MKNKRSKWIKMKIRCPLCGKQIAQGTPGSARAMRRHILRQHPNLVTHIRPK